MPLHTPRVQSQRLDNGLAVHVAERRGLPMVDVQVVLRAGAAHDEARCAGRAHMTADMLDEGTASRTAVDIAEEAEAIGATLQTRASWDYAAVSLHVLSDRLAQGLDLLADVLLRPAFQDSDFQRKHRERLHAIAQEQDDPRNLASAAFTRLVYGAGHPFGNPIGGRRETVQALTADDLRSFYQARYAPDHAFVALCGDVDADAAVALLHTRVADWRAAPAAIASPPPLPDSAAGRVRAVHVIDRPGAPQSELRVGHAGPPRGTADYVALHVANTILGGAFTSRLNILLREEKGYTYGAGSSFSFRRGGGPFLASTAVATAATADAVNDMVGEVTRLVAEPVSAGELERAVSYLVLGLPRTFETTGDVAEHMSELALYELPPDYYDQYVAAVTAVTPAEVQAAAGRWLRPDELVIVVAGDEAAVRDDLEDLDIGAVHGYDGG